MPRYINADELIFIGLDNPDDDHLFEFVPREFIDNAPTADVVEVVRCKDCIHHKPFMPCEDWRQEYICDVFEWKSEDDDFCSFAERRKE